MSILLDLKRIPLKKIILPLLSGCLLIVSCQKDFNFEEKAEPCELQTANPAGRFYSTENVVDYICTSKHCGIIPLSKKNYWIYEDSIFSDGLFQKVQLDTLRYFSNLKTVTDDLIWWKSNKFIGLPQVLFANDSSFYGLTDRLFAPNIMDAKKDFGLFEGDSIKYLTSFEDAAAFGTSKKIETGIAIPAGKFSNYLYFEKNARDFRKDQVFFKPGIGVLKYIREAAIMGQRIIKLEQISTLISYHIE